MLLVLAWNFCEFEGEIEAGNMRDRDAKLALQILTVIWPY